MAALDVFDVLMDEARRRTELERAAADRLRTLIRAGNLIGLKAPDLATASGLSRPGIYEILKSQPSTPIPNLDEIILVVLGANGRTTRSELSSGLRLPPEEIDAAVARLLANGTIVHAHAGYDGPQLDEVLLLGRSGEGLLAGELRRGGSRRNDGWTIYLAVSADEAHDLFRVIVAGLDDRHAQLLPATVRTDMRSPEIALRLDVDDELSLYNLAADIWTRGRAEAGLQPAPPHVTAVSAPRLRSEVLMSFAEAAAAVAPDRADQLRGQASALRPTGSEFDVCGRALTEAAYALRRSVGQKKPPTPIHDGESAFAELQPVSGLPLAGEQEKARRALLPALERATDTFGPLPAGQLASGGVVQPVSPSRLDLLDIARRAGEAFGHASISPKLPIDIVESLNEVALGG